ENAEKVSYDRASDRLYSSVGQEHRRPAYAMRRMRGRAWELIKRLYRDPRTVKRTYKDIDLEFLIDAKLCDERQWVELSRMEHVLERLLQHMARVYPETYKGLRGKKILISLGRMKNKLGGYLYVKPNPKRGENKARGMIVLNEKIQKIDKDFREAALYVYVLNGLLFASQGEDASSKGLYVKVVSSVLKYYEYNYDKVFLFAEALSRVARIEADRVFEELSNKLKEMRVRDHSLLDIPGSRFDHEKSVPVFIPGYGRILLQSGYHIKFKDEPVLRIDPTTFMFTNAENKKKISVSLNLTQEKDTTGTLRVGGEIYYVKQEPNKQSDKQYVLYKDKEYKTKLYNFSTDHHGKIIFNLTNIAWILAKNGNKKAQELLGEYYQYWRKYDSWFNQIVWLFIHGVGPQPEDYYMELYKNTLTAYRYFFKTITGKEAPFDPIAVPAYWNDLVYDEDLERLAEKVRRSTSLLGQWMRFIAVKLGLQKFAIGGIAYVYVVDEIKARLKTKMDSLYEFGMAVGGPEMGRMLVTLLAHSWGTIVGTEFFEEYLAQHGGERNIPDRVKLGNIFLFGSPVRFISP
ncbi:hypothetical protein KAR91_85575, partial [Candidatus Pacearchaeota archaeon]|nr:hypothetical protein [Candidatus Pacearchaeota archaeon]